MRLIEVNMDQLRNERVGETGDPLENSPTNGIVRHDVGRQAKIWSDPNRLGERRASYSLSHTQCSRVCTGLRFWGTAGNQAESTMHLDNPRDPPGRRSLLLDARNARSPTGETAATAGRQHFRQPTALLQCISGQAIRCSGPHYRNYIATA
ncbi:hypothetical protein PR048_015747 [Dryococelus australis]|uniref:Uncharacterized protein n=1 Tax=Dryococelus australis TaxID=614101 RepID=A0ABQ9HHT7_9NEOP|nr:hypothetical protein PR048_015747 [Dryococelus australis]